jgi:hypothetical protein
VKIKTRKINKKSRFMLIAFALFAIFAFKPSPFSLRFCFKVLCGENVTDFFEFMI